MDITTLETVIECMAEKLDTLKLLNDVYENKIDKLTAQIVELGNELEALRNGK